MASAVQMKPKRKGKDGYPPIGQNNDFSAGNSQKAKEQPKKSSNIKQNDSTVVLVNSGAKNQNRTPKPINGMSKSSSTRIHPGDLAKAVQDKTKTSNLKQSSKSSETNKSIASRPNKEPKDIHREKIKMINSLSQHNLNYIRKISKIDNFEDYYILDSDLFVRDIGDSLYCTLCRSREKAKQANSIYAHLESKLHIDKFLQLRSTILGSIESDDSLQGTATTQLFNGLIEDNSLTEDLCEIRMNVISEFCAILSEVSPESQCRIIGSFLTGSSLESSDVNLELIHPNTELFESDPRAKNSIHHKLVDPDAEYGFQINHHTLHYDLIDNAVATLYKLFECITKGFLSNGSFTVAGTLENLNSKVPELILKHNPTGTKLSVCCYAGSKYKLNCLLRNYLSLDERVSKLSILVKYWAKVCQIDHPNRGTLSADALLVLVIHFLQRTEPPILPCLHELINKKNELNRKPKNDIAEKIGCLSIKDDCDEGINPRIVSERKESPELDVVDEELEDDGEYEGICNEFDSSLIEDLEWSSANKSSIRKLFLGFLKYFMEEFTDLSKVISIRTLGTVKLSTKKWSSEIKGIENPVKPRLTLSRTIGTRRACKFIERCFAHGYFYLASLPTITRSRKDSRQPRSDPTNYSEVFVNIPKLQFYFEMKIVSIDRRIRFNPIQEMMRQEIFSKDIDLIGDFLEHVISNNLKLESIPNIIARSYDLKQMIPPDLEATVFCFLCRRHGHTRVDCPSRKTVDIMNLVDDPIDLKINFDEGFINLYCRDMITEQIVRTHKKIIDELEETIKQGTGLNCKLTLFGSTVNLLGSCDSDLDICMTLVENPTGQGIDCAAILKDVCVVLATHISVSEMEPILTARVPIIKFNYKSFDIDLSMYNQCAIHNSRLLRSYALIENRLPQLFYLVKRYAKACGIADASKGSLSSYAWSLLVIHFLQRTNPPMLPVLQEAPKRKQKPMFGVSGWNVWFDDNRGFVPQQNTTGLTTLFKQFLVYYSQFDFSRQVISIRTLTPINKFQKSWNNCMIAIEDPFELTYNLSGRLDDLMAVYIINSFSRAYMRIYKQQMKFLQNPPAPTTYRRVDMIFQGQAIMDTPPPVRGCRYCHKIGHRIKDCPGKQKNESSKARTQMLIPE